MAGVALVNGLVTTFDEGTAVVRRAYTQAIAFELQSGDLLVLDKGAWFGEMISIAMGTTLGDLVYDDSADWEDDPEEPSVHFTWERGLVRIQAERDCNGEGSVSAVADVVVAVQVNNCRR